MLFVNLDMGNRSRCFHCNNLKSYSQLKKGTKFTKERIYSCKKYNTEDFLYAIRHCRLGAEE